MKRIAIVFALGVLCSCGEKPKHTTEKKEEVQKKESVNSFLGNAELAKVLEAHGGIARWRQMRTLVFEIPKGENNEIHTVDLYSRKDKVEMGEISMGFDGQEVWINDKEGAYKGNPDFYHNLMFYFHAMPFVLADHGIRYGETSDLEFNGKSYPGISIRYDDGIGTSPKDEYYLHYDPDSHRMAWLGYTVTYGTNEESQDVRWIRYGDWQPVEGILLPKAITWYTYTESQIGQPKSTVKFEGVSLEMDSRPDTFYNMPNTAEPVNEKTMD